MKKSKTSTVTIPPAVQELKLAAESKRGARPLTARGVADLCGVELKTVHNWATEGLIPHFRTPGRHLRFEASGVLTFLKGCGYKVSDTGAASSVLVVAKGTVRSKLRRLLKDTESQLEDNPLAALVFAGRRQPEAIVVESALMTDLSAQQFFSALATALPNSKLYCVGGTGRIPAQVTRVAAADLKDALGL